MIIGKALYALGRLKESEAWFKRCIQLNPYSWEAFHYLGNISVAKKEFTEAVSNYKKCLDIEPSNSETLSNLANSRAFLCDWKNRDLEIKKLNGFYNKGSLLPGVFEVLGLQMSEKEFRDCA